MANWATFVVVSEDGGLDVYEARFGAVGLDLDLLAGLDAVLSLLRARPQVQGQWPWRGDSACEAAALIDLRRKTLFLFTWEGAITRMRHRAAAWEVLSRAWPGWELRWTYDGQAELLACLGLDPEKSRDPDRSVYPELVLEPDDEELAGRDPCVRVVTIGTDRCHLLSAVNDHPITEGPALVNRLAGTPDHGVCAIAAESGIHVDPERRRVGWWLLNATAEAGEMAARWPGWTVEFWHDRWEEHVRVADGRFAPPPVNREQALAELRSEALEHWSPRRASEPNERIGWMQAIAPEALTDAVIANISALAGAVVPVS
ncbi:hypothetical protein ACIPC1_28510 [Streptomyces sp. NPDC087263]|uniref:hypothetical protein n=1 Tax=Streptomyces sp. NPDC087263 TaxID=3365773 RepID=UPI00382D82E2